MSSLRLGVCDSGAIPANKAQFLSIYHDTFGEKLKPKLEFRDESGWRGFTQLESQGSRVKELQQFLKDTGFMPKANVDGVFGYATQSAVRLFQEYLRTVEGIAAIGAPDGVVGPNTMKYVEQWKKEKAGTDAFVCEWGRASARKPSPEFSRWIEILRRAKENFLNEENPIADLVNRYNKPTDTRKVADWDTSPDTIHLIGLRSNEFIGDEKRLNDDLFILLINGMMFKFWGSTDPNPNLAKRSDIPFLVEGQHAYQFGWHHINDPLKIQRAMRPATKGVLVFRDQNKDRRLTDEDVVKGLDPNPNTTINIHWSGLGGYNFSSGCQVIAGKSYVNHQGKLVDCSAYTANNDAGLGGAKGRGAFNVLGDLILTYAPPGVRTIAYTLGRDRTLARLDPGNTDFVATSVSRMQNSRVG